MCSSDLQKIQQQLLAAARPSGVDAHDSHDDGHGHNHAANPHESPWSMTLPLVILAVPSALIGLVGTPFNNYFVAIMSIYATGTSGCQ